MSVMIRVFGHPSPQGSKRGFVRGGRVRLVEMSKGLEPWREAIVSQIIRDGLDTAQIGVPVLVRASFLFDRPKAHYGTRKGEPYLRDNAPYYKASAPDLDKLQRSLGDALKQGGVVTDDDLIVRWETEKRYCTRWEREGAVIEVIVMNEEKR